VKKILAIFIVLCTATGPAHAGLGPGSTAANFLKIGVSPRAAGMGEAFVAIADDVNAIHYNPGGLGTLERQELAFMHNSHFTGVKQEWVAYAYPTRRFGTLALSANLLKIEPFDAYDAADIRIGSVDAQDAAGTVAYALDIGGRRNLSFGGAAKYIRSELAGISATAVAFDAGIIGRYGNKGIYETRWQLGAAIRNIGSEMKFISESFPLPQSLHIGGARSAPLPHPFEDVRYNVTTEAVLPNDDTPYVNTGIEILLVREFAVRAGYRTNQDAGLGVAFGLGFTSLNRGFLKSWFPRIRMDYALVDFGKIDQTHRIGLTMQFGHNKNATIEYESLFDPGE
jgi:hypothetical protein